MTPHYPDSLVSFMATWEQAIDRSVSMASLPSLALGTKGTEQSMSTAAGQLELVV